jgi:ubiquinone/menaquinone biosynthesis C-methylase UbiE
VSRIPLLRTLVLRTGLVGRHHDEAWPDRIVVMDVTRGLPYASGSVQTIYASHMLEHLYLDQALRVLGEFNRVLQPGGLCRLALPDGEAFARQLVAQLDAGISDASRRYNERLLAHPLKAPPRAERYLAGFSGASHRWQPTAQLVTSMLQEAGFHDIERMSFRSGSCPDLHLVETHDEEESMFFEARSAASQS